LSCVSDILATVIALFCWQLQGNERGAVWLSSAWHGTEKTPLPLLLRSVFGREMFTGQCLEAGCVTQQWVDMSQYVSTRDSIAISQHHSDSLFLEKKNSTFTYTVCFNIKNLCTWNCKVKKVKQAVYNNLIRLCTYLFVFLYFLLSYH
jgi:hypothetical protein